jgi:uncharacterized phage-associated protein
MRLELDKIKNATLYLAENVDHLYVTKYLKLMYYIDFISVLERGVPVTRDTYYHLPYGPVPTFIKDQVDMLVPEVKKAEEEIYGQEFRVAENRSIFEDSIRIIPGESGFGKELCPKEGVSFRNEYLSQYEVELIGDIVECLGKKSVKAIVEQTHSETPYQQTVANNIIDYRLAFYLDRNKILPNRKYEFNKDLSQVEYFNVA